MATWFITGCSTGIGRALATNVLARGETVALTVRNPAAIQDLANSYPDTSLALALDVADDAQRHEAVDAVLKRFGGIDVLVNNAGHGYRAAVEEASDDQVRELFATNFFGPVALIHEVLPSMRKRRTGTIVTVSSGGVRSCPIGAGHYVATKAALEALTTSLGKELEPLGITVLTVEPGAFRTEYKRSVVQVRHVIHAYRDTVGVRRGEDLAEHHWQPGDPARAAEAIVSAVRSPTPPRLLVLGPDALAWFHRSVEELSADIEAWRHTRLGTSFPEGS